MTDKVGWVIERYSGDTLYYWDGRGLANYAHPQGFSKKHEDAIRFARKEDAEAVLFRLLDGIGRAVEHMWCQNPAIGRDAVVSAVPPAPASGG